jgi:hypothetical protein
MRARTGFHRHVRLVLPEASVFNCWVEAALALRKGLCHADEVRVIGTVQTRFSRVYGDMLIGCCDRVPNSR